MKIGMILLAAGKGRRFGESKLEVCIDERPIIEYILSNIPINDFAQVIIVAANHNIINIANKYGISGIINNQPELGISKSIQMGTKQLKDIDAYMYCVSDQPLLLKSTIQNMIRAYSQDTILALSHNKRRGNPVIFPSFLRDELISLETEESGQKVINAHLDILKLYDIKDSTQLLDIDTQEDFVEIHKIISKKSL